MFGYINIHKDELKIKDYEKYTGYYCGVCRSIRDNYGIAGQITLTYDMTFIAVLLSGLYGNKDIPVRRVCMAHPLKKHLEICNAYTDYAAALNIMLSYHKLMDDWNDEKNHKSGAIALVLKSAYQKAADRYPDKAACIEKYIREQTEIEGGTEDDIDLISGCTGRMFGTLFIIKDDEWSDNLRKTGFFLGKFIYIMDAYEDLAKDIKNNSYNPLRYKMNMENYDGYIKEILNSIAAEAARYFERLPIIKNAGILRNVIYSGIWSRYNRLVNKKKQTGRHSKEK